jgi:excisionase family DNA binding protein
MDTPSPDAGSQPTDVSPPTAMDAVAGATASPVLVPLVAVSPPVSPSRGTGPTGRDDLLTIDEAAEHLKVSAVTISRWRRQGRLPTLKVGPRAVRIRRADLDLVSQPYHGPLASLEHDGGGTAAPPGPARREDERPATGRPTLPSPTVTLDRAERLRAMILSRRGGDYLSPAADDMGKLRDKRARRRS